MRKTKFISGLAAFLMAVSTAAVYAGAEIKGKADTGDIIKYLQSDYDGELQSYNFDLNCDNKVSILDLIYSKSAALGEVKIDSDKMTVDYLNSIACTIAHEAEIQAQEIETMGFILSKSVYSYEDVQNIESLNQAERKMIEHLDSAAKYHGVKKWAVSILNDNYDTACITGDAVLQRTGAYPAMIPRNLNIPFSNDLTEKAAEYYYEWKKDFGDYISSNPTQAELSDFSASVLITQGNRTAKNIFSILQSIAQDFETTGKKIENGKISSKDNSEIVNELLEYNPEYSKLNWYADISDYVVKGVITEDPRTGSCSAFPHTIPERLNIPYAESLIDYASNFDTNWTEDFSDCITTDPEQLEFAAITERSTTANLNAYAKTIYTSAQTLMQEYETQGIIVEFDDTSESIIQHEFIEKLSKDFPADVYNKGLTWNIISKNSVVEGVTVSDADSTGAYPNSVPDNMRIPYSDKVLKYSSGSPEIWKEKYSDYILETVETEYPPYFLSWINKLYVNSSNAYAKSLMVNAKTVIQEMETNGEKLSSEVITSDDDTELVKKIKSLLTSDTSAKWAIYVKDYTVKGAVYSETINSVNAGYQTYDMEKAKFVYTVDPKTETSYTGSYPIPVPSEKVINYDHSLVKKYSEKDGNWTWNDVSDSSGTDKPDEQPGGTLSQTSKAQLAAYNTSARTLYNSAAVVALEHELFGDPIPDGLITSDDKSAAVSEIKSSVVGSGTAKWAMYVSNGEIIGIVYTENGNITGSYPTAVTGAVKYDHSLANKYKEGNINW